MSAGGRLTDLVLLLVGEQMAGALLSLSLGLRPLPELQPIEAERGGGLQVCSLHQAGRVSALRPSRRANCGVKLLR